MSASAASLRSGTFVAPPGRPVLVVHGGAWDIPLDETDAHLDGVRRAVARGRRLLEAGQSALRVVEETVVVLEDHPAFDAGRGAVLDADGLPQLDAGIMDGTTLAWGGVANLRSVPNPVRLARHLMGMDGQVRLMVGEGAERLAAELGLPHVEPEALIVERERQRHARLRAETAFHTSDAFAGDAPRGTVGCVALDARGRIAAATSTGGTPSVRGGRVGDSAVVGAGYWADASVGLSATGWGEAILTTGLCRRAAWEHRAGASPQEAIGAALSDMRERVVWASASAATGGLIALDASGRAAWAFTTPRMARGGWASGGDPWADL